MKNPLIELSKKSLWVPGQVRPTKLRRNVHVLHMESWGIDADGRVIWHDPMQDNILHDEGEQLILSNAFITNSATFPQVTTMYLGLDARPALAEADTLATIFNGGAPNREPALSTNGYARQPITTTGGFSGAAAAPYYQVTGGPVTFGPATSTGFGPVTNRFLCTHATAQASATGQRLIASVALSQSRTLSAGDSLQTNIILQLD